MSNRYQGIVIHKKVLRDGLFLVKILSPEIGYCPFYWRASTKKTTKNHFKSMDIISFGFSGDQRDKPPMLKDPSIEVPLFLIPANPIKNASLLFFQEVLSKTLVDHYQNPPLYFFLEQTIQEINSCDRVQPVHFAFLIGMMRALGCCPAVPVNPCSGLDFVEGVFAEGPILSPHLSAQEPAFHLFIDLLQGLWEEEENPRYSSHDKRVLLHAMVTYLFTQLGISRDFNALEMYFELFHA